MQIYGVIRDSRQRGANVMPAELIPDEQIGQMVAYIRPLDLTSRLQKQKLLTFGMQWAGR